MRKKRKIWKILLIPVAILVLLVPLSLWFTENVDPYPDEPIGGDWRTWRGYTKDYALDDNHTVTFSFFKSEQSEGCIGYAVYDASTGMRIGTILLDQEHSMKVADSSGNEFRIEDVDGDGLGDIGIPLTDRTVLWYSAAVRGNEAIPMFGMILETTDE